MTDADMIAEIRRLTEANDRKMGELDRKLLDICRHRDIRGTLLSFGFSEADIARLKPAEARWLIEQGPDEVDEFAAFETADPTEPIFSQRVNRWPQISQVFNGFVDHR